MHFKDLRIGLRQLAADPGYTAVVVFGLALAAAFGILLLAYLDTTLKGDADVPHAERVVRIETKTHAPGADKDWIKDTAIIFHDYWKQAGAPVEASTRYDERDMSVRLGDRISLEKISFADPQIAQVFGLTALSGDIAATLSRPDGVVISEGVARRLFGARNPIGQSVVVASQKLSIGALVADRPPGSLISTHFIVSIRSPVWPDPFRLTTWNSLRGQVYVRMSPGATIAQLIDRATAYYETTAEYKEWFPIYGRMSSHRGVALPDIALSGAESQSTRRLTLGLSFSFLIVSMLAAINFVNLSVVRTIARQREVGIRKALGASPLRIASHFMLEAALVAAIAAAIGLLLAWLAAPLVGDWLQRPLSGVLVEPQILAAAVLGSLILGLVAGAYPAWVALRVDCAQSLAGRGHVETRSGLWLRRALSLVQFACATAMIATTVVVVWQTLHAAGAYPGYDSASVLAIEAPVDLNDPRLEAFRDALRHEAGIRSVGIAWDIPGRFKRNISTDISDVHGKTITMAYSFLGPDFFQSYGVTPLAGRVFDPDTDKQGTRDRIVINASAAKALGFTSPQQALGAKPILVGKPAEIIGVIPDIRQRSLRDAAGGMVYGIDWRRTVNIVSIRSEDPSIASAAAMKIWPRFFPDEVLRIEAVQAHLARVYDSDLRLGKLIGAGGIIALALAGFGLYALSAYTVRRRTAEIVLRKLHGARRRDIARLLARELGAALLAGALLGLPVAAWLGEQYLAEFVDRAPIGFWALAMSLTVTTLMALLAATRHTARAMALSPARALRV